VDSQKTVLELALATLAACSLLLAGEASATEIKGRVTGGDAPIIKSTVTFFAATVSKPSLSGVLPFLRAFVMLSTFPIS
jgi:hypothetical protein